jgi:hypothetical protein
MEQLNKKLVADDIFKYANLKSYLLFISDCFRYIIEKNINQFDYHRLKKHFNGIFDIDKLYTAKINKMNNILVINSFLKENLTNIDDMIRCDYSYI